MFSSKATAVLESLQLPQGQDIQLRTDQAVAVGLGSEQRARVHAFAGHRHAPLHHESPPHGYEVGYSPRNIPYAGAVHISKFVVPVRVGTSRGRGREDLSQVDNLVNSCPPHAHDSFREIP